MATVRAFGQFPLNGVLSLPASAPTCEFITTAGVSLGFGTVTEVFTGCYMAELADVTKQDVLARWITTDTNYSQFVTLKTEWSFTIADVWGVIETVVTDVAAAVWNYAGGRTIDMTLEEIEDTVSAASISITRGNTIHRTVPGLSLDENYIELVLKEKRGDPNVKAVLILSTAGLTRLNGKAVSDATLEKNKLTYSASEESLLIDLESQYYVQLKEQALCLGIKQITAEGAVTEKYQGTWTVKPVTSRTTAAP